MRLGRKRDEAQAPAPTVDQAAAAVEELEAQLAGDRAELERLQAGIVHDEREQDALVALEAEGEIDSTEAQARFEDLAAAILRARTEVDRVSRLVGERERHLSRGREGLARARFAQARDGWAEACEAAGDIATAFAAKLAELEAEAAALTEARRIVDETGARARALAPVDVEVVEPEALDEPDWNAPPELLALLEDGPRRPQARTRRAIQEHDRERKNRDLGLLKAFAKNPSRTALEMLEPHLQEEGERILAAAVAHAARLREQRGRQPIDAGRRR